MENFDLVIIGSGSGNSLVTEDFARKRVAVVEAGIFGGTCLNVGCIPTKMFVYPADVAAGVRAAARYGVDAHLDGVRWADIRDRVFGRIDPISAGGKAYRENGPNTTLFTGRARFVGDRMLEVDLAAGGTARIHGEQVVVATGSHARVPDLVTGSGVEFHTSDTVMRLPELPSSMLVLGGGYIAAEFAHVFSALGAEVTVVARGDKLLRHLDGHLAQRFTDLASERWDVRTSTETARLSRRDGAGGVRAELDDGSVVEADAVLVALGRVPSTSGLDADRGGIELRPDGRVVVDAHGRTTATGVWSLGDVSSPYQLKHVANAEARVVAHNLTHPDDLRSFDHRVVPAAVFTHPQIASVGETTEELEARGARYVSATQAYGDVAFGWAMEDREGLCRVLADPADGRLLGVHILGYQASMLIQPAVQAMSTNQTVSDIARTQYWIHPALTEVLENALLALPLDGAS